MFFMMTLVALLTSIQWVEGRSAQELASFWPNNGKGAVPDSITSQEPCPKP